MDTSDINFLVSELIYLIFFNCTFCKDIIIRIDIPSFFNIYKFLNFGTNLLKMENGWDMLTTLFLWNMVSSLFIISMGRLLKIVLKQSSSIIWFVTMSISQPFSSELRIKISFKSPDSKIFLLQHLILNPQKISDIRHQK